MPLSTGQLEQAAELVGLSLLDEECSAVAGSAVAWARSLAAIETAA